MTAENFVPSNAQKNLYTLFITMFILSWIASMILLFLYSETIISYFTLHIMQNKADMLFIPGKAKVALGLSGWFLLFLPIYYFFYGIFVVLLRQRDTVNYFDEEFKKNYAMRKIRGSTGSFEGDKFILYVFIAIAAVIFPFSLFCTVKVTDEGISQKDLFALSAKQIAWSDIYGIELSLGVKTVRRNKSTEKTADIKYIVFSSRGKFDLMESINYKQFDDDLIKFSQKLFAKNKDVNISLECDFSGENLRYLRKIINGEKRLKRVYNYLQQQIPDRPGSNF